jgi:hypothetical protein
MTPPLVVQDPITLAVGQEGTSVEPEEHVVCPELETEQMPVPVQETPLGPPLHAAQTAVVAARKRITG